MRTSARRRQISWVKDTGGVRARSDCPRAGSLFPADARRLPSRFRADRKAVKVECRSGYVARLGLRAENAGRPDWQCRGAGASRGRRHLGGDPAPRSVQTAIPAADGTDAPAVRRSSTLDESLMALPCGWARTDPHRSVGILLGLRLSVPTDPPLWGSASSPQTRDKPDDGSEQPVGGVFAHDFVVVRPLHGPISNRRWRKNPVASHPDCDRVARSQKCATFFEDVSWI